MKEKKFDCVKLKHNFQMKIQEQIKGMTPEEKISFFRKAAEDDSEWVALKKRARQSLRP